MGDAELSKAEVKETSAIMEDEPDVPTFIVGIGASAGGLEALERFFQAVPMDTDMAFVVIQHLSPDFKSLMDELLARFTKLPIVRVDDSVVPKANAIYLLPPRKEMVVRAGRLVSGDKTPDQPLSMPINTFFRSLARELGTRSVAIVLSGTGTDGTLGLLDVQDAGGLVLAQSPDTAKFDGMPRSAIGTGQVDAVMAPEDMPKALVAYAKNPTAPLMAGQPAQPALAPLTGVPAVIDKLREVYGLDFNYYKAATISRRIDRRVVFRHANSVDDYCARVLHEPEELDALYKFLLIGVTRFFRDTEVFAHLEKVVIPEIVDLLPPGDEARIWVPGCATGEEAYSIAILFIEAFDQRRREPQFKIFASDVHRDSLQTAADGFYDEASLAELTEERRERFFDREPGGYRVIATLRRHIVFSHHNLIRDPPFTRIDLVSCRNLLIYLQPAAQMKALSSFHFALEVGGHLVLGPSEGVNELQNEFDAVERQWKIFRKLRDVRLPMDMRADLLPLSSRPTMRASTPGEIRMARVYDAILKRYVPTAVLVDSRREVIHVFGDAERFLRLPAGRMSADLVSMMRGDLRVAVSSAIQNALKKRDRVAFRGVSMVEGDKEISVDIVADPITDPATNNTFVLVLFEEQRRENALTSGRDPIAELTIADEARTRIQQLEAELQHTKDSLHTTVEELETSNEELQASNEELLAANEELQSTNEELHSVNEELYSVNAEHEQKIRELNRVSSDLKNLIPATEIGTIFLDRERRVRLFTPAAARLFNLMTQDIDRDIRHITTRVKDDDVFDDIDRVTETLKPSEKRVYTTDGGIYLRRVMPYFDVSKAPSGLVLTFVDITALSLAEDQMAALNAELARRVEELASVNEEIVRQRDAFDQKERFIRTVTDNLPGLVGYWGKDLRCQFANPAYIEWFGLDPSEMIGKHIKEILGSDLYAQNVPYMQGALAGKRQTFEREIRKPSGEIGHTEAHYIPHVMNGEVVGLVVLVNDITERKVIEQEVRKLNVELQQRITELRESEERFRLIFEGSPYAIMAVDAEGRIRLANTQAGVIFGCSEGDLLGEPIETFVPEEARAAHRTLREGFFRHPEPRPMARLGRLSGRRKDGSSFPIEVALSPLHFSDRIHVLAFINDKTRTQKLEVERDEILRKMTEAQKLESLGLLAGNIAHDFNNLLTGIMANASLLLENERMDREEKESVDYVLESSRRAAELCQQLLVYSGRGKFLLRPHDVSKLVEDTSKLVRASSVNKRVELRFDLAQGLPPVLMDATQIRQVIMNLVINASEAVSSQGGQISIRTGEAKVTPELLQSAMLAEWLESKECVFIEVSDNGGGIKAEDLKRIFEPFYTTKFTGRGLGLSAVLGIVRGHHGALTVKSEIGRGTTFVVLLPPAVSIPTTSPTEPPPKAVMWRGSGVVLIADDEAPIRNAARRLLMRMGFEVELASDGAEAVAMFTRDPSRYVLVLLDLTMPGMTGAKAFIEIRRLNPSVRVMVMSGFSEEDASATMAGDTPPNGFLPKPFDFEALSDAVRQVME